MRNQYFLKDKKALVYEWHRGSDHSVYGNEYFDQISANPLWCYAKQTSQDQRFENMAYGIDESRMFVFGYNPRIKPRGLVKYNNLFYEITRVDTSDDYQTDMFVYVREMTESVLNKIKPFGFNPED